MKRLLILAVGLLVVVGLGGTAVTFLLGPDDEPPRPEAEIAAEPEPEAAAPVEEHEAPPALPVFVMLEIIDAPVLRADRLSHYLHVETNVQVVDKAAAALVREKMPFLRDAVIRRLHHEPLRHTGGKVDLGPLRKAIMASAESVVGPDQVVDVLIAKIVKGR